MSRVHVKICGLTTPDDVRLCHGAGARYLGVILAPGPRCVPPDSVKLLRDAAPEARLVGIFVDAAPQAIGRAADHAGFDLVQLHGREDAATVRAVRERCGVPVIKAVRPGELADPVAAAAAAAADFVLFDLPKGVPAGEELRAQLWEEAAAAVRAGWRVLLAGGLTPADAAEAAHRVGPHALDVASGVEVVPGRKDPAAVRAFLEEVARACA
ncbi:MAG: phosphoribosylanthranilate isomerase [bacterium]|nr:phosphoribosylanthranilate isomerase [bacterium]